MEDQWKFQGGRGGLKSQNFKRPVWDQAGISRVGGIQTKNPPWEGYRYMYFLEQHHVFLTFEFLTRQYNFSQFLHWLGFILI